MPIRATFARCCALCCAIVLLGATVNSITPAADAAAMARAANTFLASFDAGQRWSVQFDFGDNERFDWHFVPRARRGLSFKSMKPQQRELARELLRTGLSQRGYLKAQTIIELGQGMKMQPSRGTLI